MQFEKIRIDEKFMKEEAWPLFMDHYGEVSANKDIPLKPDFERYFALQDAGALSCYTVRQNSTLVGYAFFIVQMSLHYSTSKQAYQDLLYLNPNTRGQGVGRKFIDWCDSQLKADGVQVVYQRVKTYLDFGPLLSELGYAHVENNYSRRLDK